MMCNCIVDANAHVLQLVSASKDFVKSFCRNRGPRQNAVLVFRMVEKLYCVSRVKPEGFNHCIFEQVARIARLDDSGLCREANACSSISSS